MTSTPNLLEVTKLVENTGVLRAPKLTPVPQTPSPEPDSLSAKHQKTISLSCPSARGLTMCKMLSVATQKLAEKHMAKDAKNAKRLKVVYAE